MTPEIPHDTVILKDIDSVYARLMAPGYIKKPLEDHYAIYVDGYHFMPAYKMGRWDGRIRFLSNDGKIYQGLIPEVKHFMKKEGYEVIDNRTRKKATKEEAKKAKQDLISVTKEHISNDFTPRPYQAKAAYKAIVKKRGIILHSTGSGKSFSACLFVTYLRHILNQDCILYVVPRIQLVDQTRDKFVEYGFSENEIGRYYGSAKELDKPVIKATWQSLDANHNELKESGFYEDVQTIIIDECHGTKAKVLQKISKCITNAEYRIGFTGTLPDNEKESERMLIKGVLGPVIDKKLEESLTEDDYLANMKVDVIFLDHEDKNDFEDFWKERQYIEENKERNNLITNFAKKHAKNNENALILVEKIDHGKTLQDMLPDGTSFIRGEMGVEERQEITNHLKKNNGNIVVATSGCFSTGIDIPNLHCVILSIPGKSKIRTLQSIGRGLRTHESKEKLRVYDIADHLKYAERHLQKRIQFYVDRSYDVNIIEESDLNSGFDELFK